MTVSSTSRRGSSLSMQLALLLSVLFLILNTQHTSVVHAQRAQVDAFVEKAMQRFSMSGLGLAVVWNGSVYMSKGYGRMGLDNNSKPVTEDTLFNIGSTSKAITSAVLAQMLSNCSKFTLDSRVRDIMPEFYLKDIHRQELLSVRDLLSHNAGVSDNALNGLANEIKSPQDSLQRSRFFNNVVPFRSKMTYNNLHYTAAGTLMEHLKKPERLTWEDAITRYIFEPLGMNSSGFHNKLSPAQLEKLATPYEPDWSKEFVMKEVDKRVYVKLPISAPCGTTFISSARDMVKWLYLITHEGRNEAGEQVIDADVLKATMTPTSITGPQQGVPPFNVTQETYGLGWLTGFQKGHRMAFHSGYVYGYHAEVSVYPDKQLAMFSVNNGQLGVYALTIINTYISEVLLENKTKDFVADFLLDFIGNLSRQIPKDQPMEAKQQKTKDELKEYVGRYGNYAMGNISVEMNETTGRLVGAYGNIAHLSLVESVKADIFIANFTESFFFLPQINVTFGRNESGQVVTLTVPFLLPDDPPVFTRDLGMSSAPPPLLPGCPVVVSPDMDRANCSASV